MLLGFRGVEVLGVRCNVGIEGLGWGRRSPRIPAPRNNKANRLLECRGPKAPQATPNKSNSVTSLGPSSNVMKTSRNDENLKNPLNPSPKP